LCANSGLYGDYMNLNYNKIKLFLTIGAHYVVFIAFVLTALLGLLVLSWYVAITLDALIFRVIFSNSECPLTTLENHYRSQLGLITSKGFLKDYIIYPKRTFKYLVNKLK